MNSCWSDLWSAGNSCQAWICEIRWTLTSQTVLQNKWMRLALTAELVPLRRWKFSMTECWRKSLLSNAWWKLGSSFYRVESYGVYYQKPCCLFFFQVSSESRFSSRPREGSVSFSQTCQLFGWICFPPGWRITTSIKKTHLHIGLSVDILQKVVGHLARMKRRIF